MLLADVFRELSRKLDERTALGCEGETRSFSGLDRASNRVAQGLLELGVGEGDRVAILARNCIEYIEVLAATVKIGACLSPVNHRLTDVEIRFILEDARPSVLIVAEEFREAGLAAVWQLDRQPEIIVLSVNERNGTLADYRDLKEGNRDIDPRVDPGKDLDVLLLYTSGTTGNPKGVRITNENYSAFLESIPEVPGFSYKPGSTVASTMPLFHVAGINVVMAGLSQECQVTLFPHFQADRFIPEIQAQKINYAFLAPAMIVSMLESDQASRGDYSALDLIAYGASPITNVVLQRARSCFECDFAQLYGMTESTGAGTFLSPEAHLRRDRQGACGVPWPGISMQVLDSDGQVLAPGVVGELVMKGNVVSPGYRNRPGATAESLRDGWLHTGDAGYMDEEGFYYICDRIKDLIITGGENVSPVEVENAIADCPGVRDVAVIGVPSEKWGEAVKAVVVPDPDSPPSSAAIMAWARRSLAGFKAPRSVDFIDEIPRNASGKVLKRKLRELYRADKEHA